MSGWRSQARICRTAAALWAGPGDVAGRVLDVAGLAVDAVLRVDLKARLRAFPHNLVDGRRTIALRGLGEARQVLPDRHRWVGEPEMDRLILLMIGAGEG